MTEDIQIIKATIADLDVLEQASKQSFFETYAARNTEENMQQYLLENFSAQKLLLQIKNPDSEFYLAMLNGKIAGYLKINFGKAQTEENHFNSVEIERIYVLKEFQGKKIGQLLCNKAFQAGQLKKMDYLWLGVWEENLKAIRFYKKYGFTEFGKHIFKLGNDEQQDIIMKLIL